MMDEEKAQACFSGGICCAMAVFGEFAAELGLDEMTARKIASGFGSGLEQGSVCGCVLGALMALGLRYGNCQPGDQEGRRLIAAKKRELEAEFIARCGSLRCPELLEGLDISDPQQQAEIRRRDLYRKVCIPAICTACEIVEDLL